MTRLSIVTIYCQQCPRTLRTTPAVARKYAPAACPACGSDMRVSSPIWVEHPTGSSPERAA